MSHPLPLGAVFSTYSSHFSVLHSRSFFYDPRLIVGLPFTPFPPSLPELFPEDSTTLKFQTCPVGTRLSSPLPCPVCDLSQPSWVSDPLATHDLLSRLGPRRVPVMDTKSGRRRRRDSTNQKPRGRRNRTFLSLFWWSSQLSRMKVRCTGSLDFLSCRVFPPWTVPGRTTGSEVVPCADDVEYPC